MPTRTNRITAISADSFGTGAFTTAPFTPSNNSLLTVIAFGISETDGGMEGTSLTITDSLGLSWTNITATTSSPNWSYGVSAWRTAIGTGQSMTVSIDCGATNIHSYRVVVDDWTDYDTATPIGATALGTDADGQGAASINLSASPASSSYVIGCACVAAAAGNITVTAGATFTETSDVNSAGWCGYQVEERTGSTSTTVDWNDLDATGTGTGAALMGYEVRHTAAVYNIAWVRA